MYITPMAAAIVAIICALVFAVMLTALLQEQQVNKRKREAELVRLGQINAAASILGAAIHRVFYSEARNEKDLQDFLLNGLPASLNTLAKTLDESIKEASEA